MVYFSGAGLPGCHGKRSLNGCISGVQVHLTQHYWNTTKNASP